MHSWQAMHRLKIDAPGPRDLSLNSLEPEELGIKKGRRKFGIWPVDHIELAVHMDTNEPKISIKQWKDCSKARRFWAGSAIVSSQINLESKVEVHKEGDCCAFIDYNSVTTLDLKLAHSRAFYCKTRSKTRSFTGFLSPNSSRAEHLSFDSF